MMKFRINRILMIHVTKDKETLMVERFTALSFVLENYIKGGFNE